MDIISEDIRQSAEYGCYMNSLGWNTVRLQIAHRKLHIFIKKVGPWSVAKVLRTTTKIDWNGLEELLKQNKTFNVRFEPRKLDDEDEKELRRLGYHRDSEPLRATKTVLVDLSVSESELLRSFMRARSWIKKHQQESHRTKLNDYELFFNLWKKASKLQHIWSSDVSEYENLVRCFKGKVFCLTIDDVCGCLILMHKDTAYYYYAAALPEAKEKSLPYLVVWEAMKEAKKRGCVTWDWEGIFDPRWPNKKWLGFSQFKKTFGGKIIDFPGSYSKWSIRNVF